MLITLLKLGQNKGDIKMSMLDYVEQNKEYRRVAEQDARNFRRLMDYREKKAAIARFDFSNVRLLFQGSPS